MFINRNPLDSLICEAGNKPGVALRVGDKSYSYKWISSQIDNLCSSIIRLESTPRRIFCQLPNSWENLVCMLTCIRLGIEFIPIPISFIQRDLDNLSKAISPDAHIYSRSEPPLGNESAYLHLYQYDKRIKLSSLLISSEVETSNAEILGISQYPLTLFTSGSTGVPKGVMFSYDATLFNLNCWKDILNLSDKTKLFVEQGCLLILASYLYGGEVILPENQISMTKNQSYLEIFDRYSPDTCFMMPAGYEAIAKELVDLRGEQHVFGRVTNLLTGGAPLSDGALSIIRRYNKTPLQSGYGLTEVPLIAISDGSQSTSNKKCVGKPFDGIEVEVKSIIPNEPGNILVSSPGQSSCYIISGNKKLIPKSSFDTGDLGYLDENGLLYIVGRANQCLKNSSGSYIGVGEIESKLETLAQSRCCSFILGKEREFGSRNWGVVISDLDKNGRLGREIEMDLLKFISINFPDLNLHTEINYLDGPLPFNTAGKVDRISLATMFNVI